MTPGLCECGCGQIAPIAPQGHTKRGWVKGQPLRFIRGHVARTVARESIADRFWQRVQKSDGCWLWTGRRAIVAGYGLLDVDGYDAFGVRPASRHRARLAHRISYELASGAPIHDGLWVLHRCDNPPCVRPDHLFLGTNEDNMKDCAAKGRFYSPARTVSQSINIVKAQAARMAKYRARTGRPDADSAVTAPVGAIEMAALDAEIAIENAGLDVALMLEGC